ncbi:hypothetical protein Ato02nite_100870 [Paractinoplanes toevensis]|uniref:Methyl-accepting transducer domain-containing protein n=2 Tax=Paractinoplanes toevensis TaxID=571911 RepID=A0A920BRF5_9ACTN|nr:hypothetical protein Ato02nite_100870 [Actinoplanes toevensis]
MRPRRTFGSQLATGFGLCVILTLLMGSASVTALSVVVSSKDEVITSSARALTGAEQLNTLMERRISDYRYFLLDGSQESLNVVNADRARFLDQVGRLTRMLSDPAALRLLDTVSSAEAAHAAALNPMLGRRKTLTTLQETAQLNVTATRPARLALEKAIKDLTAGVRAQLERDRKASSRTASAAIAVACVVGGSAVAAATAIAVRLNRRLRREVGTAVNHIQGSSAQLQAAAAQQASGGRAQSTAMNEITTTINGALLTSREIADHVERLARTAEDTATAAHSGGETIEQTRRSLSVIRTQVDQIVHHMAALGEKSQQIGGVVELVAELAQQTNILAINAAIEATGAGEWGHRFAVVADEIRKLADRTAASANEIHTLVDDVRDAVGTTVTATEIGATAVDSGTRQFDDANDSFQRIAQLVMTTNDATREIELSTQQQSTAMEQVNLAASDTARITQQTGSSAAQTRQTAEHLTTLSRELLELIGTAEH